MQQTQELSGYAPRALSRRPAAMPTVPSSRRINVHEAERMGSALAGGLALAWGLASRSSIGKAAALVGGGLVYRGVSGHCHLYQALGVNTAERADRASTPLDEHVPHYDVLRSVTIQKTPEEVYRAWKQPAIFARAMSHLAELQPADGERTRWTIRDPLGMAHSWETEVVEDKPDQLLRWASTNDSPVVKTGTVSLKAAPGNRGTEVTLRIRLEPPSGVLGRLLRKLIGKVPSVIAERALFNFKCLIETGELPSLKRNPAARPSAAV
jgi:uncharacterized membrane protein